MKNKTLIIGVGSVVGLGIALYFLNSKKDKVAQIETDTVQTLQEVKQIQNEIKEDVLASAVLQETKADIKKEIAEFEIQIEKLRKELSNPYYIRTWRYNPKVREIQQEIIRLEKLVKDLKMELI